MFMRVLWTVVLLLVTALTAQAEVPLDGTFLAQRNCPALQSINRQTNPGNVTITPGSSYRIVAANKAEATHYWIVVPGAQPDRRWVAVDCGTIEGAEADTPSAQAPTQSQPTGPKPQYILAVSWQPAFCEAHSNKPECRSQTVDRFDADHFTLHGLWPQPRLNAFCGVSAADIAADEDSDWNALPPVVLSARLRTALDQVMPGTSSQLERHEWTKHGTCYGATQEQYFTDALAMMTALNASPVAELFAANIGRQITQAQIRAAFDQAFGPGAGQRVRIACDRDGNRSLIGELTIGLTGTITAPGDFAPLIAAASPTDGGCDVGVVDRVGLQ
ncbi:MAG: ribonuclease [Devosia sp.]